MHMQNTVRSGDVLGVGLQYLSDDRPVCGSLSGPGAITLTIQNSGHVYLASGDKLCTHNSTYSETTHRFSQWKGVGRTSLEIRTLGGTWGIQKNNQNKTVKVKSNLQRVTSQKKKKHKYLVGHATFMRDGSLLLQLVHDKHDLILPMPVIKQITTNTTRLMLICYSRVLMATCVKSAPKLTRVRLSTLFMGTLVKDLRKFQVFNQKHCVALNGA